MTPQQWETSTNQQKFIKSGYTNINGENILIAGDHQITDRLRFNEKRGHQNWNCRTLQGPCSATRL